MNYTILIILIIAGLVLLFITSTISSNKKLKSKLEKAFGKEPMNQDYELDSIDAYHYYMGNLYNNFEWIDDITWNDLDMDKVFRRINVCCTSVGEEYLYHILHTQQFDTDDLIKREKFLSFFKQNPDIRLNLQIILSKLGKNDYNGLASFMNNKKLKQLRYPYLYTFLAFVPLVGIIITPLSLSIGMGLLIVSFVINIVIHYTLKRKIEADMIALEYFAAMLWCSNKICKIKADELKPFLNETKNNYSNFKSVSSKISQIFKKGFSELDFIEEYIKILFLSDIRDYNRVIKSIHENMEAFKRLYINLGELDSSISILSFRESLPFYCIPEFRQDNTVEFSKIYHPLLSAPISNNAIIDSNCIITGSNASGKSTFIKSVAINVILAQTIYTCTSYSYSSKFSLVMTSMAVRDNISEGESYFITEIKSLKRILDKIGQIHCLCFIDEILKGTNTIERIASSAAVLKYLDGKDCLCMVASHDIELTEILKYEYDNYHFSEQITDDGIYFDYLLKKGPSQTRNAIKLLHFMGFDDNLVRDAENHVETFMSTQKW